MRTPFPATTRLTRPSEFVSALKGRRIARGALFVVNTPRTRSISEAGSSARLGLIIPKRFASRAVTRNTIKRVIRESFRHLRHQLPARDYIFRLHSKAPEVSLTQLKKQVRLEADELFKRVQQ